MTTRSFYSTHENTVGYSVNKPLQKKEPFTTERLFFRICFYLIFKSMTTYGTYTFFWDMRPAFWALMTAKITVMMTFMTLVREFVMTFRTAVVLLMSTTTV